ncbi:uncharacterized protein LOC132715480 [Ruditapes philippinarum]|uniref:uncharacterized protein LOC132715480 n=1 Tax=Ruditapes philippinarum TaxID=129788 RepID=UPI00295B622F|nr:uncharacterized protein LOC132715480 [Ruditapes philippinarum]
MPRLAEHLRNQAIGLLEAGVSKIDVARRFNCHVSTITRLQNRYNASGSVKDLPKSGRPRITTRRQDVNIRVGHLRNRFEAASSTARRTIGTHGRSIHANTVRNRLKEVGLRCRRPLKASRLTARHKRDRLRWARVHIRMNRRFWSRVLFSDETKIVLSRADGRARVWRHRNERYAEACIQTFNR